MSSWLGDAAGDAGFKYRDCVRFVYRLALSRFVVNERAFAQADAVLLSDP